MAKSKEDRYETPKQLAAALTSALGMNTAPSTSRPAPADVPVTVMSTGIGATEARAAVSPGDVVADTQAQNALASPSTQAATGAPGAVARSRTRRPVLLAVALVGGLAVVAAAVALAVSRGGGDDSKAAGGATTTAQSGGTGTATTAGVSSKTSLLDVLVPTEIASTCATRKVPASAAVETDVCTTPEDAATSLPDEFELSFYANAKALQTAYKNAQSGLKAANCGGSTTSDVWTHPTTGKTGDTGSVSSMTKASS